MLGKDLPAWLPGFAGSVLHRLCQQVLDTKTMQDTEETVGQRVFHARVHAVPDGVMAFITEEGPRSQQEGEGAAPRTGTTKVDRTTPLPGTLNAPALTRGTVLIVDDEPFMRELAARVLRGVGFQTRTAATGQEAIDLLRRDASGVQLIVLDLLMPDMDGWATLEALRQIRGDIIVLVASGRLDEDARSRNRGAPPSGYLAKPYSLETLVTAVERALRGDRPA
jgi:CheY-like chemotaxis protein